MNRNSTEYQIFRLTGTFSHTVRDPLWRDIPLSDGFKELFSSKPMQKLNRIKQLGPAHLLYPGAVHTRADHSLGVFHVSRLIILSLLSGSMGCTAAFELEHEDIQAMLAAAMLHDLGHFPYAHALKDIVTREHESLGSEMIKHDDELCRIIEDRLETSVERVCMIIDEDRPCEHDSIRFFRSILSGTLDPDKLDYLSRDALFCGIPYGMQDASYIIRNLSITKDRLLAIPFDSIGAVEHLLFAKYSMYRNVYWHHVTRGATSMIKKAILLGLADGLFIESDLYDHDDESFGNLFASARGSRSERLFSMVRDNRLLANLATQPFESPDSIDKATLEKMETDIHSELRRAYPALGEHEVIIDIPERVSFESDIPILMEDGSHKSFSEVDELFSPQVVASFVSSLRKVRLYLPSEVDAHLAKHLLKGVLEQYG